MSKKIKTGIVTTILSMSIIFSVVMIPTGIKSFAEGEKIVNSSNAKESNVENLGTSLQNITFSNNDFVATQDYTAYAEPYTFVESPKTMLQPRTIALNDPKNHNLRLPLDSEEKGLLLTSTKTGKEAENLSFSLSNKQLGDFSMDFRVFSKETYRGYKETTSIASYAGGDGLANEPMGSAADSRFNPYLDMRGLGMTFTSVSDDTKEFTVHFYGTQAYSVSTVVARVGITGEENVAGRHGYGIRNGNKQPDKYGYATELMGTSFSNAGTLDKTFPVSIRFDQEKMCIYGTSYSVDWLGNGAKRYNKEELLIRNLADNTLSEDGTGEEVIYNNKLNLNSSDFEAGYTVKLTVEDMTDNKTELTWAAGKELADEGEFKTVDSSVYKQRVRNYEVSGGSDGVIHRHLLPKPYERNANILIYNVNGYDMRKYDGFSVSEVTYSFPDHLKGTTLPTAGKKLTGRRFVANVQNGGAEGESFKLNAEDFMSSSGNFGIKIGAKSAQYAKVSSGINPLDSMGIDNLYIDPYSDVRQISLTIRSKADNTKGFKVYLTSRTLEQGTMVASVEVFGEDILNRSGVRGIGEDATTNQPDQKLRFTKSMGTFGMLNNMSNDSYNNQKDPYPMITFDPKTLEIKCFTYDYNLIRKLDKQYKLGNYNLKTLTANDFANGFDVEVTIEKMNTQFNKGLKEWGEWTDKNITTTKCSYADAKNPLPAGNYVLTNGYDRNCIIDVFSYWDGKQATLGESKLSGEIGKLELDLGNQYNIEYSKYGNNLTPCVRDGMGNITNSNISDVQFSSSNGDNGTVTDDKVKFGLKEGIYNFTFGNLSRTINLVDNEMEVTVHNDIKDEYSITKGETLNLSQILSKKEGYELIGFSTNQNAETVDYNLKDNIKVVEDLELYPIYKLGTFEKVSLSTKGDISLNFYVALPKGTNSVKATFVMETKTPVTIDGIKTIVENRDYWKFTYPVAAKDYLNLVEIRLTDNNGEIIQNGNCAKYSVNNYLKQAKIDTNLSQEVKNVCEAMEQYCSAAKAYFDNSQQQVDCGIIVNTENLNKTHALAITGIEKGVTLRGATLVLRDKTCIRIYFDYVGIKNIQDLCANEKVIVNKDVQNNYYIEQEVVAGDLNKMYTFTIGNIEIKYGVYTYISGVLSNNPDINYSNVVKTLYNYGEKAVAYHKAKAEGAK